LPCTPGASVADPFVGAASGIHTLVQGPTQLMLPDASCVGVYSAIPLASVYTSPTPGTCCTDTVSLVEPAAGEDAVVPELHAAAKSPKTIATAAIRPVIIVSYLLFAYPDRLSAVVMDTDERAHRSIGCVSSLEKE
jgi:hypothetical protein